jgi:hypothetical protein
MTKQRRLPFVIVLTVSFALAASACSVEEVLPLPNCVNGDSALIVAQSVPTAEWVPCLESLPPGWEKSTMNVNEDGTVITFDSDRAGSNAAVGRFFETCDLGEAVQVRSEHESAERFEFVERVTPGFRARRFYVFEGGCASWEFDFDDGAPAALSIELVDAFTLYSRAELNEGIRSSFIDAEL